MNKIPFNRPYLTGEEQRYIQDALTLRALSGNNNYTQKCAEWLENTLGTVKAFLTPSCTASLEMCAILLDIRPGDEVIVPSFTFVSTANAFVLRGAVPVFVDIDPVTLNISPECVRAAITHKTKAVIAVHYAGHACDMAALQNICADYGLFLIEDAAQAILSKDSDGRYLGTIGDLGCLSFHETKNIICGEGGALLVNNESLIERAHIIQEKGTNRAQFLNGHIDKYTWRDIGSSFYPAEIVAAFLYAQLTKAFLITEERRKLWARYHASLSELSSPHFRLPQIDYSSPSNNAHIYFIMTNSAQHRARIIEGLARHSVMAVFHYIPLHCSPAGNKLGRTHGELPITQAVSDCLLRLPLWIGLDTDIVAYSLSLIHI